MACFYPLKAYQQPGGDIKFHDNGKGRYLELPCGQCIGCRLERSRQWAMRCVHEASMHDNNCFITLTYNPENLPPDGGLIKSDFQKFMKRLRKYYSKKKFDIITVESMAKQQIDHITMRSFLDIILTTGCTSSIHPVVRKFILVQLLKKYGV